MDDVLSGNDLRDDKKDKRYFQLQNRYLALPLLTLVLLLAFISSLFHLILVKSIVVFLCFYNNKSRFSIGDFTVEPFCMQMSAFSLAHN